VNTRGILDSGVHNTNTVVGLSGCCVSLGRGTRTRSKVRVMYDSRVHEIIMCHV
jgi:hypothetical protein